MGERRVRRTTTAVVATVAAVVGMSAPATAGPRGEPRGYTCDLVDRRGHHDGDRGLHVGAGRCRPSGDVPAEGVVRGDFLILDRREERRSAICYDGSDGRPAGYAETPGHVEGYDCEPLYR
ncbi:MAG: hypothetical protein HOV94_17425 [Saccharothrix sp.]|nr:hypothetical protein [Saccharothrix sp.]